MSTKVETVVAMEWEFFGQVEHLEGRACCQDNFPQFERFRTAQFAAFDEEVVDSYLADLQQYKTLNYNPIMLKYAYMMESSDPAYFSTIQDKLPPVEEDKKRLIEQLVLIQVEMREEFNQQYPLLASQSRLTYSSEDSAGETSFETYLRGELSTYSPRTLYLYAKMLLRLAQQGKNLIAMIQVGNTDK